MNVYPDSRYSTCQSVRIDEDYPLYIVTCYIIYLATSPMSHRCGNNDTNEEDKGKKDKKRLEK